MERQALSPIDVTYNGIDADEHRIDLVQVGQSLAGMGRMYNSVIHFYYHGHVLTARHRPLVRTYTGNPETGCVNFTFVAAMLHQHLPFYPEILKKCADKAVSILVGAIFAKRTGHSKDVEKSVEALMKMGDNQTSLMHAVLQKDSVTEQNLFALIDKLTSVSRPAMAEMVAPIGQSCHTISHFSNTDRQITVDEPTAVVMRSKENLEVGPQTEMAATILGVDRATGSCRIEFTDTHSIVRGKITDPALQTPHNVYTSALDTQKVVMLTAKPVLRAGEIASLYISDARLA